MRGAPEAQVWEFSHPKFHRDRPDLLETIRRKTMDDSTTSTIAIPLSPANTRLHQTRSASAEAARGDRSPSYTSPSDANVSVWLHSQNSILLMSYLDNTCYQLTDERRYAHRSPPRDIHISVINACYASLQHITTCAHIPCVSRGALAVCPDPSRRDLRWSTAYRRRSIYCKLADDL